MEVQCLTRGGLCPGLARPPRVRNQTKDIQATLFPFLWPFLLAFLALSSGLSNAGQLVDEERFSRLSNAHELLGKFYEKSAVINGEQIVNINTKIYSWTRNSLPTAFR